MQTWLLSARTLPSRSNGEARLLNVDARCNARACPHICVPGPNRIHRVHIFLASRGRDIKRETKKRRCLGRNKDRRRPCPHPLFSLPLVPVPGCLTARPPSVRGVDSPSPACGENRAVGTVQTQLLWVPGQQGWWIRRPCARTVPSGRGFHRNPHAIPALTHCNK